ncbi:MAG: NADPH-dependent 7-cyano-7-deazaguanine reductase QueF [Rickettsiaceae bacterium]|nr:NADPH-dependent 7-cyano-7-deazaguanine reductase QueF [Rickettsiaceae bacterium]
MEKTISLPLGNKVAYKDKYDNTLLYPIARSFARKELGITDKNLPFKGYDLWNCYEVSWLNSRGKPVVKIMSFYSPATSINIIESKSLKLYLNSFNNTKFKTDQEVLNLITNDLSNTAQADIHVQLHDLSSFAHKKLTLFAGTNIDNLDVSCDEYIVNPNLLKLADTQEQDVTETITSNLLKANCLVTNQPDWATLQVNYTGLKINHQSLLQYIVSFRNHSEFHEQCVERIFNDIMQKCQPTALTVHAKFTRRGGIDINPFRSTTDPNITVINNSRDIRQ